MSMVYKEGTASLTKGSPVLKGKDTYFLNPIFNVGVGQIVQVKTGDNVYVNSIKEVVDNETLILSFDSLEDVTDGEIVIMITMVDSISDTANKLLGMTRGLVQFETEMTKWFTSMDKKIIITLPDGTKKEVYTLQAIMEQVAQNEKEMQELLQNSEKKVNDMVDKAQTDVNQVVTDGTNKINQAVDKADKEINEAITSGTGKIDTMLTESQKKIDKTIEDTEVKVDTELGKIDEKIGNRIDGKVDKSGDRMTGSLGIDSKEFSQSIEINADAEQDRTSIGNKFKDGSLAVLSFYKDKLRYAGKDIVRVGDFGIGDRNMIGDQHLDDLRIPQIMQQPITNKALLNKGYPFNSAGVLEIKQTVNGLGDGCLQIYTDYIGNRQAIRSWTGSTFKWKPWNVYSIGNYGLGATADDGFISTDTPPDSNDVTSAGFFGGGGANSTNYFERYKPMIVATRQGGDGTGAVLQIQSGGVVQNPTLGYRIRVGGKSWSDWSKVASLDNPETQRFRGQVTSMQGVYSLDINNPNTYFGMLRANKGDQFGIYCCYEGVAHTLRLPKGVNAELLSDNMIYDYRNPSIEPSNEPNNKLARQSYHDFRKHFSNLREILTYPYGYSSGFVDYKSIFGGSSTRAVGLVNFRNWGDKSGHGSCFQLMSVGGDGVDGYTGLYYRQGITGSDQYPEAIPNVFKLLDNRQVEGVDNSMLNNTNMPTMFFRQGGGSGTSDWFSGWGSGINLKYDWNNSVKIFFHGSSGVPTVATKRGSDIWWNVLWGSGNTTTDSNGFIKKASPIIDINHDGTFTTNDESEGATVTRVAQGEYLIEGVLGFNSDAGWGGVDGGIEIPLDVNKQPLVWVDSEVLEDGSIILRTYHREHKDVPPFARNLKRGYNDGDPCDIPKGRFISLRVNMPEESIYNVRERKSMEEMREMESNPFYKEERAFPNIIFNKKGDL